MHYRRSEDQAVNWLLDRSASGAVPQLSLALSAAPVQLARGADGLLEPASGAAERSDMLLVVATGNEDEVLMAGAAIAASPQEDAAELLERAAMGAAAWRQQWLRIWKRYQLPGRLVAFFDELSAADSREAVSTLVAVHAVRIVGAYAAVVLLPQASGEELALAGGWSVEGGVERFRVAWDEHLLQPGLISAVDVRREGSPLRDLAPLVRNPEVAMLAHLPLPDGGVLILAERRCERIFTADDWEVLGTLAAHCRTALNRLAELERARSLSLTDPLTGLANRRQLEVVLPHAWAAAQRGEGLAVLLLDLDDFKEVNDRYGHLAGDDLLRIVAECLQQEARGADAVVRYGGDEFLVVLPRATASGARALAERVRRRLAGWVSVSEGVASFHASYGSAEELIDAADEDLYRNKPGKTVARLGRA